MTATIKAADLSEKAMLIKTNKVGLASSASSFIGMIKSSVEKNYVDEDGPNFTVSDILE